MSKYLLMQIITDYMTHSTLPLFVKLVFKISFPPNSGFYIKIAWKIDLDQLQVPLVGAFWKKECFLQKVEILFNFRFFPGSFFALYAVDPSLDN